MLISLFKFTKLNSKYSFIAEDFNRLIIKNHFFNKLTLILNLAIIFMSFYF